MHMYCLSPPLGQNSWTFEVRENGIDECLAQCLDEKGWKNHHFSQQRQMRMVWDSQRNCGTYWQKLEPRSGWENNGIKQHTILGSCPWNSVGRPGRTLEELWYECSFLYIHVPQWRCRPKEVRVIRMECIWNFDGILSQLSSSPEGTWKWPVSSKPKATKQCAGCA